MYEVASASHIVSLHALTQDACSNRRSVADTSEPYQTLRTSRWPAKWPCAHMYAALLLIIS